MPTRNERRRPRADPGAFNCSGRGLPSSEVYARKCEKVGLMKKERRQKQGCRHDILLLRAG
jgi:hypothetical protein